ncbi:MAG: MmcQ/YjbR family DNA-binding protein [Lachnospiraceae bacterium]
MKEREEAVIFCMTLKSVYQDMPFHDPGWIVIRHKDNHKIFAWIFERENHIWINVKCNPEWRDLWRNTYKAVLPGWHLNKEHWNSIILDETIPDREIHRMIEESYDLTKTKQKKKVKNRGK